MKTALLLILSLACATAAHAQAVITYVNGSSGANMSGAQVGSIATSTPITVTAMNHLVVGVRWATNTPEDPTVTDSAGNTFVEADASCDAASGNQYLKVYYAQDIATHAADVVTATWGTSDKDYVSIIVLQHSGIARTSSYDTCVATADTTPSCETGLFTTTVNDELFVTFAMHNTGYVGWTPSGGATQRITDDYFVQTSQTEIVSATVTNATRTMTSDSTGIGCVISTATFKRESAPGGSTKRTLLWGVS